MEIVHYITQSGEDPFQKWIDGLKDIQARIAVLRRIDRVTLGNFGDHKPCRDGVSEMRVDTGPGYRVYYFQRGQTLVILLCGGEKHGQDKDIDTAISYRQDYLNRLSGEKMHEQTFCFS